MLVVMDQLGFRPSPQNAARAVSSSATARSAGIDLARGIAVLGMFAVHVGERSGRDGLVGDLYGLAYGRVSALFALLAGVSLVFITGRHEPKTDVGGRREMVRVLVRAAILFVIGTVLTTLGSPIETLLAYYALCFVLAFPLAQLRAGPLARVAGVLVVAGPALSFVVRAVGGGILVAADAVDPVSRAGGEGIVKLLFTGNYPAATWLPFVVAGMAIGRAWRTMDVKMLLAVGSGLVLADYGVPWAAARLFGGLGELVAEKPMESPTKLYGDGFGLIQTDSVTRLLSSEAHSGTPFDVAGSMGVAIVVLALAILVTHTGQQILTPLITVGTMSLSAYVGHIAVIALLGASVVGDHPGIVHTGLMAGTVAFCLFGHAFSPRDRWKDWFAP